MISWLNIMRNSILKAPQTPQWCCRSGLLRLVGHLREAVFGFMLGQNSLIRITKLSLLSPHHKSKRKKSPKFIFFTLLHLITTLILSVHFTGHTSTSSARGEREFGTLPCNRVCLHCGVVTSTEVNLSTSFCTSWLQCCTGNRSD